MTMLFLWYLIISLAGWGTFPLVFRLFPGLPDRGYAFSRTLAWLVWSYIFWLLSSFGILHNSAFGILSILVIIGLASVFTLWKQDWERFSQWIRNNLKTIFIVEGIFLAAFLAAAFIRSTNPEALGTEKPMELAFINAILRSDTFPPHDPWLSGYSISYYYFGYVMVAMLAKLSGASGGAAFNLGISLVFALSAVGAYGLVFNLLEARSNWRERVTHGVPPINRLSAFLGPIFLLLVSNLEGFLHVLHSRGLFWVKSNGDEYVSKFWQWLDIQNLSQPPAEPFKWMPDQFWWWWRASRVLQDYDLLGRPREIIDEFPFFSFLLADLHPHVLAMPFALLAIALILHVFLRHPPEKELHFRGIQLKISFPELAISAVILGSLGFLNTWDFPIYVILFAIVYATRNFWSSVEESNSRDWLGWMRDFFLSAIILGISGVIAYLPFYFGFSSQAGGFVANFIYTTRGAHLWVMFGTLLLPIGIFLIFRLRQDQKEQIHKPSLLTGLVIVFVFLLVLLILGTLFGGVSMLNPDTRSFYLSSMGANSPIELISQGLIKRFANPGGWISLAFLLGASLTIFLRMLHNRTVNSSSTGESSSDQAELFATILIILGGLLVIFPEFFFLRDQFGWRMNTIFKFYYQAWIIWSVAAAFGSAVLFAVLRGVWGILVKIILVLIIAAGLVYPLTSLPSKTNQFSASGQGLDSAAYLEIQSPDEAASVRWLLNAPFGIVAEAVSLTGGSYTSYARIATLTGLPAVLGWMGHESQWRGGSAEMGTRMEDIAELFCARSGDQILSIARKYNIRYVVVGPLERTTYTAGSDLSDRGFCTAGLNELLIQNILVPVFQSGSVTIYEVPGR